MEFESFDLRNSIYQGGRYYVCGVTQLSYIGRFTGLQLDINLSQFDISINIGTLNAEISVRNARPMKRVSV
jgi:hypothetical protein